MKVSFIYQGDHFFFDLELDEYMRLIEHIKSDHGKELEDIIKKAGIDPTVAHAFISYERSQKKEKNSKESDASCDYSDHL